MNLKEFLTSVCLDSKANIDFIYDKIVEAYNGRPYHNLRHIQECIRAFNILTEKDIGTLDKDLMKLAIIFHDFVYVPGKTDNENRSALVADTFLKQMGIDGRLDRDFVCTIIEMTDHCTRNYNTLFRYGQTLDVYKAASIVCDCDLAILSAQKERFDEYEKGIREEYSDYQGQDFTMKRSRIIASMLMRPKIYLHEKFYIAFEKRARRNLAKYELQEV